MLSAEPPNLDLEALELRKTLVFQADITTEDFFFLLAENEKKEEEEEKKPGSQCLQMVSTQLGNRDHCCHPIIQYLTPEELLQWKFKCMENMYSEL